MSDTGHHASLGINAANLMTWAIVVLGMGVTYGTLYGAMRGNVDNIAEINNRQDDFVKSATELLTSLQLQNVQVTADLRQMRETIDRLAIQMTGDDSKLEETASFLQGQINDLRHDLAVLNQNVNDLRHSFDNLVIVTGADRQGPDTNFQNIVPPAVEQLRSRSPSTGVYKPDLRGGTAR